VADGQMGLAYAESRAKKNPAIDRASYGLLGWPITSLHCPF